MRSLRYGFGFLLVLATFLGGSIAGVQAQKERYATVYDADGRAIHLHDIVKGTAPGAVPVKVNGFTVTDKAGTFAAYGYQVKVCPTCKWVETAPKGASLRPSSPTWATHALVSFLNMVDPPVKAADGDSIIWGS